MEGDKDIQHVTQEVLTFVAFKMRLIKEPIAPKETSSVSLELLENLCKIVWAERYIAVEDSKEFKWNHLARMAASPHLYTTYVIYACHLVKKCFQDPYEMFVRTLTLAVQMALYSIPKRVPELLGWTLTIFPSFFEAELEEDFHERGGWKNFNSYLLLKNSLTMYPEVDRLEMQMKTFDDMKNILKILATPLQECMNDAIFSSQIEGHEPTLSIWDKVEATGFAAGSKFINKLLKSQTETGNGKKLQGSPKDLSNMAEGQGSEAYVADFLKSGRVEVPLMKRGATRRIAYLEAMQSLKDLQENCLEIERLLDFCFGDIPEDC